MGAHKFILSGVSPVFRAQFGVNFHQNDKEEVLDSSYPCFLGMINYLYENKFNINQYEIEDLFELMRFGDKYQIKSLVDLTADAINKYKITKENILVVANTAKNYEILGPFSEISTVTFQRCVTILHQTLKTA